MLQLEDARQSHFRQFGIFLTTFQHFVITFQVPQIYSRYCRHPSITACVCKSLSAIYNLKLKITFWKRFCYNSSAHLHTKPYLIWMPFSRRIGGTGERTTLAIVMQATFIWLLAICCAIPALIGSHVKVIIPEHNF